MRIVLALGGNALGLEVSEQLQNAKLTASYLKEIIKEGHELVITHGNGPQVGLINLAFLEGRKVNPKVVDMPFTECNAMSQGYIGYHLALTLNNELLKDNIDKDVIALVTEVLVDKEDKAFKNPTKPVGPFYTKEQAEALPYQMKEDSGRGYRRVVPSPLPKDIVELKTVISLLEAGKTVITCGGGGIPVIMENNQYVGVDAVIDKDHASSLLASKIDADMLLILTQVENAKIHFGTELEQDLHKISAKEIEKYNHEGEFKAGSMKPKVEACLNFLANNQECLAVITDIKHALEAIKLQSGTIIYNEE